MFLRKFPKKNKNYKFNNKVTFRIRDTLREIVGKNLGNSSIVSYLIEYSMSSEKICEHSRLRILIVYMYICKYVYGSQLIM